MKVVFLSKFYPRSLRSYYLENSKAGLAFAADAHQYALASGLNNICPDFEIVNLPAVFPYPTRYRKIKENSSEIEEDGLKIHNVGFNNLLVIQHWSRYYRAKKKLKEIVDNTDDTLYIVIYSTSLYSLRAATEIKKKCDRIKLCMIVPDLPSDMRNKTLAGRISLFLNSIGYSSFESYCKEVDSFVLLTKYMIDGIPSSKNHFMVSEGVYDENDSRRTIAYQDNNHFTILYSGTLNKRFGVMNLVDAIHGLGESDIQLHLYGVGDSVNSIIEIAKTDRRIIYKGSVSRDEVIQRQSEASLLVNPRIPDNNPFTKYSFPSKTMEYLASGVPTLIYELDGIPEEYYDYCYHLSNKETDVVSLQKKILNIKNTPYQERKELSLRARRFILTEKSSECVGQKIFSFLQTH